MNIKKHVDLSAYHTLAAPAIAHELCVLESIDALKDMRMDDFILGGGSNIIFMPEIKQRIVQLRFQGIEVKEYQNHIEIKALAGTTWQALVAFACAEAWYGLENLAAIYGTVGAAPVQNIGAYGVEIAELIHEIEVYDRREKRFFSLSREEARFEYRNSYLKQNPHLIVVAVIFHLQRQASLHKNYGALSASEAQNPWQMMQDVMALRAQRLPNPALEPNAGSFFHNPIVSAEQLAQLKKRFPEIVFFPYGQAYKIAAAWCIEYCGFKGLRDGKVGISEQHALVLVNHGGTGNDILNFASHIQKEIQAKFDLSLMIEPNIVGSH